MIFASCLRRFFQGLRRVSELYAERAKRILRVLESDMMGEANISGMGARRRIVDNMLTTPTHLWVNLSTGTRQLGWARFAVGPRGTPPRARLYMYIFLNVLCTRTVCHSQLIVLTRGNRLRALAAGVALCQAFRFFQPLHANSVYDCLPVVHPVRVAHTTTQEASDAFLLCADASERSGDNRRWQLALTSLAFIASITGRATESLAMYRQAYASGHRLGDGRAQSWGLMVWVDGARTS